MRLCLGAVAAGVLALAPCGVRGASTQTLQVLAAASLTDAFRDLGKAFEKARPGSRVELSFAGSQILRTQIEQGAPGDVFASADEANMKKVTDPGLVNGSAEIFATNQLVIAVAPGNPKKISSLADLTKDGLLVVVCAPQVPCGAATQKAAKAAGVALKPKSEEQDVKAVLTKVAAGEADAGLVYVTDVNSSGGKVVGVDFAEAAQAINRYPIAVLKDAPQADLAKAFVQLVRGDGGRAELTKVGFRIP